MFVAALSFGGSMPAKCDAVKWDYLAHPVTVTENRPAPNAALGMCVASAFDGYGALGSKPACARAWHQGAVPTEQNPLACEIDYGTPTLVTAFVHYFYVPGSRDMRFTAPGPSAMKNVRISARDDKGSWQVVTTLSNLTGDCPQVLPTGATKPWRFWKLEILKLAPGPSFSAPMSWRPTPAGFPKSCLAAASRPISLRSLRTAFNGKNRQKTTSPPNCGQRRKTRKRWRSMRKEPPVLSRASCNS